MSTKILNILFIVFLPFKLLSTKLAFDVDSVGKNVYAGESQIKEGKTVYFGMELVTYKNILQWNKLSEDTPIVFNKIRKSKDPIEALEGFTGKGLKADGNEYIVYASRKKVEGPYNFLHQQNELRDSPSLRQYNENYNDLLMVSLFRDHPDSPVYENKGIFRMPKSLVEGSYKHISMSLLGFAANVFKNINGTNKYMMMANDRMQMILGRKFMRHNEKELFMGTNKSENLVSRLPPRIHLNTEGIGRILKENEDARDYNDTPPPEDKVEYTFDGTEILNKTELFIVDDNHPKDVILIGTSPLRKHHKARAIYKNSTVFSNTHLVDIGIICQNG